MEIKEALDIIMYHHDVENETLTDKQEEAYQTYKNNLSEHNNNNLTDEEKSLFTDGYLNFKMYSKETKIKRKFADAYLEKIKLKRNNMNLEEFDSALDELLSSDEDFNLNLLKIVVIDDLVMSDFISDELRERIWHKLPENKEIYYLVVKILEKISFITADVRQELLKNLWDLTEEDE